MKTQYHHTIVLWMIILGSLLTSACTDLLRKDFHIDTGHTTPQLAIHATVDVLDGIFTISIGKSRPVIGVNNHSANSAICAVVRLFESDRQGHNERQILEITKPDTIDLPPMYGSNLQSGNQYYDASWHTNIYASRHIAITPGKTYRLTVEAEGFETASSTVIAPAAAQLGLCSTDVGKTVKFNNILDFTHDSEGWVTSSQLMNPCKIEIIDLKDEKNYYLIELLTEYNRNYRSGIEFSFLGTNTPLLIQENPNIEAYGMLSGENIDLFLFDQLLISDLAFTNSSTTGIYFFTPPIDDREYTRTTVSVRNVTLAAFKYYRSVILQGEALNGMMFSEPTSIVSNVSNGFGCFSITSSARQVVFEGDLFTSY